MDVKIQVALVVLCSVALFQQCQGRRRAPSTGLRVPPPQNLMTYSTFVNKVSGGTWSEIYYISTDPAFPDVLRLTIFPEADGNSVYIPFQENIDGVCFTEFPSSPTDFTVPAYTKHALLRDDATGTVELRFFSSYPDNYIIGLFCFDTSTIVDDVCGTGYLSLMVPQFPPIQLDWWSVIFDMKRVMGLEFTDPRFRFSAGADMLCGVGKIYVNTSCN